MTKNTLHYKIWQNAFGDVEKTTDAFGDEIIFDHFNSDKTGSWYIDIMLFPENPENVSEKEKEKYINLSNLQPLSLKNCKKKYKKQKGAINGKEFVIIPRPQRKYVGIMLVDGKEVYLYDRWQ